MPTLNWIGKDKVVNHAAAVPFHVLEHKYNFGGASENKIIHGDNLLALKSLLPEYEGRVKCIYIVIEKSDAGSFNRPTMKFKILGQYPREGKRWQIGEETAQQLEAEGRVEIVDGIVKKAIYPEDETDAITYKPFWSHLRAADVGTAQSGKELLNSIMGKPLGFDTVKPSALIEELLCHLDKDSIVLDSFAGSGTTAHAVLNLNAKDGGNRKFILVEMEDYAESITAERVRRVIQGYGQTAGTGGNFDFYEVGEPLMIQGNLNQNIDIETIHAYIWYTETHTQHKKLSGNNNIYLGNFNGTAIYFYYERNRKTILDNEFLRSIKLKADSYLIYADACTLTEDFLTRNSIIFKKIPRDIKKLGSDDL